MSDNKIEGLPSQSFCSGLLWNSARALAAMGVGYGAYELMRRVALSANEALNLSVGVNSGTGALLLMKLVEYGRYSSRLTTLIKERGATSGGNVAGLEAQLRSRDAELQRLTELNRQLMTAGQDEGSKISVLNTAHQEELSHLRQEIETLRHTNQGQAEEIANLKSRSGQQDGDKNAPLPSLSLPPPLPPPPPAGSLNKPIKIVIPNKDPSVASTAPKNNNNNNNNAAHMNALSDAVKNRQLRKAPPANTAASSDVKVDEDFKKEIFNGIKLRKASDRQLGDLQPNRRADMGDLQPNWRADMGQILATSLKDKFKNANAGAKDKAEKKHEATEPWTIGQFTDELRWVKVQTSSGGEAPVPEAVINYMDEMSVRDSNRLMELVNRHREEGKEMAPLYQHVVNVMVILYQKHAERLQEKLSKSAMPFINSNNDQSSTINLNDSVDFDTLFD